MGIVTNFAARVSKSVDGGLLLLRERSLSADTGNSFYPKTLPRKRVVMQESVAGCGIVAKNTRRTFRFSVFTFSINNSTTSFSLELSSYFLLFSPCRLSSTGGLSIHNVCRYFVSVISSLSPTDNNEN